MVYLNEILRAAGPARAHDVYTISNWPTAGDSQLVLRPRVSATSPAGPSPAAGPRARDD